MGLFGKGEEYSKVKYDAAATEEEKAAKEIDAKPHEGPGLIDFRAMYLSNPDTKKFLEERVRQARMRVQKLFEQGHKEALELNEEYDSLWREAQKALDRVAEFEHEKLGMPPLMRKVEASR